MKRYRLIAPDFDTRANVLSLEIREDTDESVKNQLRLLKQGIRDELRFQFGDERAEAKMQNLIAMGMKPYSIVAFHNLFFEQIRNAFIIGSFYPALTGVCALGERILNHLIITLREEFRSTTEYKQVHRKASFDNWDLAITTLKNWGILLPKAVTDFSLLKEMRNKAIHFRPETDHEPRTLALEAILCLQRIVEEQFSGLGSQPWFISVIPNEKYIKQEWESRPFVKHVYLPNCMLLGYRHRIQSLRPPIRIDDDFQYEDRIVSDDEFVTLRTVDLTNG
ncbi:MAG: hypothetical protein WC824_06900 [Bacteroidota bacterium]|jgi:hypothetical protein